MLGINFYIVISFYKRPDKMPITWVVPALTWGTESFAKYYKCGTIITNFSGETILINFVRETIEAVLTSFSESLSKLVKI